MDSHRGARVSNIVEMLKPYSYEVLCNIDAFILVFCSVGLWLSSVPHIVHSLRMIQDSSTKEVFFQQPSSVMDYQNDSYGALLSSHSSNPATLIFLYAKWDADSRHSRSAVRDVNEFSPLEVCALSCWRNECSSEAKVNRYPELRVHIKDFGHLTYRGHFVPVHISNFVSYSLRPIIFVNSEEELSRVVLTHKFTIVNHWTDINWKSAEHKGFYAAALRFPEQFLLKKTLEFSGIDLRKDLVFVVATFRRRGKHENHTNIQGSPLRRFFLTIYAHCENSVSA
ncbi:hypothetical protein FBUS_06278 [Fasciolopsis buskii]|uniref:Uncharacterized protein n=1 Tax=Fasciolopsis buskii TaxID=27845 RepID=A0A8E0RUR7_9TREM|nr:hypothetical protein FBUS_06278 [Fasciolopsis buski]